MKCGTAAKRRPERSELEALSAVATTDLFCRFLSPSAIGINLWNLLFRRIGNPQLLKFIEPPISLRFRELRSAPWAVINRNRRGSTVVNYDPVFIELGRIADERIGTIPAIHVLLALALYGRLHALAAVLHFIAERQSPHIRYRERQFDEEVEVLKIIKLN